MFRLSLPAIFLASPALAHPSHIGELAGHDHLGGIILIGLAAAIGLWAALKGRKDAEKAEADSTEAEVEADDEELQDA